MKNSLGIDPEFEDGCPSLNIVTCSDAELLWEEFDFAECPICKAKMTENGIIIHEGGGH